MSSVVPERGWRASARSVLRWLPSILVTAAAFLFLAFSIDWGEFLVTLRGIPVSTLALVVAIYLISMVARALCWQTLLQRKVSLGRAVLALNEGYFFNNILPLRLGEVARAVLLGRHTGLGTFNVLSTIVVERAFDVVIASGLLLATIPLVLRMEYARPVATLLFGMVLALLVALYFAARYRAWLDGFLTKLLGRYPVLLRLVMPPLNSLLNGFAVLNRPQYFLLGFFFLASSWGMALYRDWALISALHPGGAPIYWAMLAISASNLGGALPAGPASIGVFEAAAVTALTLAGMSSEAAFAYALIIHVTHLISSSLIGGYALSQEGESLMSIYSSLRSTKGA